jgi:translation initiation factor 1A
MVRNFGKGGKGAKKMRNGVESNRILLFKENGQEYAVVQEMLGHGMCLCSCTDNLSRLGIIRGNMRKGSMNRVHKGDTVLVSLRDFQDNKADIVHLYTPDEVRSLQAYGELQANPQEEQIDEFVEFS